MRKIHFEWDEKKNAEKAEKAEKAENALKHKISFYETQQAFLDPRRIIAEDLEHSQSEKRYYCFGKVDNNIITVRFTYRGTIIRIIGAGYWRKGKKVYEQARR